MSGWSPIAPDDRTVLAKSEVADWPWVFEAWLQEGHEGGKRVHYTLRVPRQGFNVSWLGDDQDQFRPQFLDRHEGDESVCFGPVPYAVSRLFLTPTEPEPAPEREASVIEAPGLAKFFVCPFDIPVTEARLRVEPSDAVDYPFPVHNLFGQMRRQYREGHVVAEGATPKSFRWRLRVWPKDATTLLVSVMLADARRFEMLDSRELVGNSSGSRPLEPDEVLRISGGGGHLDERAVAGQVVPAATSVRVGFDDGSEREAEVLRTSDFVDDFFIAFYEGDAIPVSACALDEGGKKLGTYERPPKTVEFLKEERAKRRANPERG